MSQLAKVGVYGQSSILVVDDDRYARLSMAEFLTETGYVVLTAEDAKQALALFHKYEPTLLIIDIKMPGVSGLGLLAQIREQQHDTPVIMVSGAGDSEEVIDALKLGATDFITKPIFDLTDLEHAVAQCIQRACQVRDNKRYREHLESEVHAKTNSLMAQVSERRKVDLALRRSELKFQSVIANATDIIMTLSPAGSILSINPAFKRLTAMDTQQWIGQPLFELLHHNDRQLVQRHIQQAALGIKSHEIGCRILLKDDGYMIGELIASALIEQGQLIGLLAIIRDITERKQAEYEKEQLQLQLIQAQKLESIGRLAGGVAHDFNNALTAILGFSELALTELPTEHAVREYLEVIRDAGEKAATLTRQLLAFGRKQILQIEHVCLNTVVLRMGRMLQRLIGQDILLHIETKAPFDTVLADPAQLEQIIMNLVINARDAMPNGGELWISTDNTVLEEEDVKQDGVKPGLFVELTVRDTGHGMSEDVLANIFEPFYTTKAPGKGTGLGLATVFGVLSQHRGFVTAHSVLSKGATFRAYLPAMAHTIDNKVKQTQLAALRGGSETLLIVDDEAAIRKLLERVLSKLGYRIYCADSGKAALAITEKQPIHLLLTDMMMPGMSGLQLTEQVMQAHSNCHAIIMSGYVQQGGNDKEIQRRGLHCIEKPLKPHEIAQTIRCVLDSSRGEQADN